ncbi:YkvA family protein [Salinimicrobium xinjiangense]|uniref:YkvA family protein n=1 Tax=Salinimicrobium xinjiangense TaxID=438596 RepID=UPI0003FE5DDF|nr:YkvA family protein [Salinimicrobium xinjiangense]
MKEINPEEANRVVNEQGEKVKEKDLERLLTKEQKIEDKFRNSDSISSYLDRAKSMFNLIRDYWSGEYANVPWKTIAAAAGALLYVLMPLDLIPDFIPIVGLLDDAAVIAACLKLVSDDLVAYEKWKLLRNQNMESRDDSSLS